MNSISVFGLGYVGAVTASCLAQSGHQVWGVDVSPSKVEMMNGGRSPVLEPGLDELVRQNRDAGRLHATTDSAHAVQHSDISFVCVGTPSLPNGRLDLSGVERCCEDIGRALRFKGGFHWVVLRSTMLPGTAKSLAIPALESASGKRAGVDFAVCVNPEFTREGCAVADFMNPALTILGADDPAHLTPLEDIYRDVSGRVFITSCGVAEMVKYACNSFHALKVTFANELGFLCNQLGVDAQAMTEVFTADTKLNISAAYLKPGFAFGGSCLPKDVRALAYCAKQLDADLPLLRAILPSNRAHLERAVTAILATKRRKVAVLGLSFKNGTDDLRESPSVHLVKRLLGEGCRVKIWDPDVALGQLVGSNRHFIEEEIPHIGALLCRDLPEAVAGAEVLVVGAKSYDAEELNSLMRPGQMVIDVRAPQPAPQSSDHAARPAAPRSTPVPVAVPAVTAPTLCGPTA